MILEFVHSFKKILSVKDFFRNNLSLEIIEDVLKGNEVSIIFFL